MTRIQIHHEWIICLATSKRRISLAIDAINERAKPIRSRIAAEFHVPLQKLRSRLNGHPPPSDVRGRHLRALSPSQELALIRYLKRLDEIGIPASYPDVERAANSLLAQNLEPNQTCPKVGEKWTSRWLKRNPQLTKMKRKPLAVARKNAEDPETLKAHFERFRTLQTQYGIQAKDLWNFDETGFRIGCARNDFVIVTDKIRKVYSKNPDNREYCTSIECINAAGDSIPPLLILQGVTILSSFFNNDLDDRIAVTTAPTGYSNDWISLEWIKHFDKHTRQSREGGWRMLILDGYGSHHTMEFLSYCWENNILPLGLPSHTTHLLQPLDVCVFQPLKHWHSEAIREAINMGAESFTKRDFLAAFNGFRTKAFKKSTVLHAWRNTGHWPYNPDLILDPLYEAIDRAREATPPPPSEYIAWETTPITIRTINVCAKALIHSPALPDELLDPFLKTMKGAMAFARTGSLMEDKLSATKAAENTRKRRKLEPNYHLQSGGLLTVEQGRAMTRERLEEEEKERNR